MDQRQDAAFWDEMYRGRTAAWDHEPNPFLPDDIAGLEPGTALDVACGEGSDAVWLAKQGWTATAVDISQVALDRGRAADGGHLVTWVQADILTWQPPADAYDLVSVHFSTSRPPTGRSCSAALPKPSGSAAYCSSSPTTPPTWN